MHFLARSAASDLDIRTIYLGGHPEVLPVQHLKDLLRALSKTFNLRKTAEVSLETTPTWRDSALYRDLRRLGLNRVALEVAGVYPEALGLLGKDYQYQDINHALQGIREAGIENLSLDLSYGLPGQGRSHWRAVLDAALDFRPVHLTVSAFEPEEGSLIQRWVGRGLLGLPPTGQSVEMYQEAMGRFREAGYRQYELTSWSKPGSQCQHNLAYWRLEPYLGLGVGAVGFAAGKRTRNIQSPSSYTETLLRAEDPAPFPATPASEIVQDLSAEQHMQDAVLMGLHLTEEGISRKRFRERFGKELGSVFEKQIRKLDRQGLLSWEEDRLRLTAEGILHSRYVLFHFVD